ncbi:MAG: hypothetical protein PHU85_20700 [Phycisphaerae bacterium]|nr:hypothetical protein [Phycisphaerae bacterium]
MLVRHRTPRLLRSTFLLPLLALLAAVSIAEDLFDPAEAEKYRLKPKSLTGEVLKTATTQPAATQPATSASQPDSPFAGRPGDRDDVLPGYIELNDGSILPGWIYPTREKPWSVFEAESKSFRRIPPIVVRRIEAEVVWERDEPDWRWKENGSDEKIFTGRTYPARMVHYRFTLANGEKVNGTVQQPIHVRGETGDPVQFILHERDKGPLDSKLSSLIYVKHVELGKDALARGKELAAKRATSQPETK